MIKIYDTDNKTIKMKKFMIYITGDTHGDFLRFDMINSQNKMK